MLCFNLQCENLPHDATSGVTKSFNNGTDFSKLYSTLSSRVSSATAKNLSVPIGFVCLLHLANEKVKHIMHACIMNDEYTLVHSGYQFTIRA